LIYLYPPSHAHRTILVDFVGNLRERLLAEGMIGEAELEELTSAAKRHLDDSKTLVVSAVSSRCGATSRGESVRLNTRHQPDRGPRAVPSEPEKIRLGRGG
jgi:hypothetical protein